MKSRIAALLLAWAMLTVCATTATATPKSLPRPSGCSARSDSLPGATDKRPVVYVHGWTGNAAGMSKAAEALAKELGDGYAVYRFDYAALSTTWPVGTEAADCLAYYLLQADQAYQAGGGKGVLAVGHSMGGLALRSAARILTNSGDADSLLGFVTIDTPHRGSPLGGSSAADFLQKYSELLSILDGTGERKVLSGSSAAKCLAKESDCEAAPYVEGDQRLAALGTQITIEHQLFAMQVVLDNPTIRVFGDGIVPLASAIGYYDSGEGPGTTTQMIGARTLECLEGDSQLRHALSRPLVSAGLEETIDAAWSIQVSDSYLDGKFHAIQIPSLLLALGSTCSHTNVINNSWAAAQTADLLGSMVLDAGRSPEERATDRRRWLYDITNADADGTGARTQVRFGDGTQDHQNSTAQALGCDDEEPVTHEYQLDGLYESLTATLGNRLGTDPLMSSEWSFEVDGDTVQTVQLTGRQTQPIQLDLVGKQRLTVSAAATGPTGCQQSPPLGVLGDAFVMEASKVSAPEEDPPTESAPAESLTAKHGWPTTRHDSNPAFFAWLGAASAWGTVHIGMVDWLSCGKEKICVSGTDNEVLVTTRNSSGFVVLAEFVANEPARTRLKALHLKDAQITELLRAT